MREPLKQPLREIEKKKEITKIIFLDMDGVLCTHRACIPYGDSGIFSYLDPVGISMLNDVCQKTSAKIVISSSWRKLTDNMDMVLGAAGLYTRNLYFGKGEKNAGRYTPNGSGNGYTRGHEIQDWLRDHPSVTEYVILDDDGDMLQEQLPYFVQTDIYDGIGFRDYQKMLKILGYDTDTPD